MTPSLHIYPQPLCPEHGTGNQYQEGGYKATWNREFKFTWREVGPPNRLDDTVDSDQCVLKKKLSLRVPARRDNQW